MSGDLDFWPSFIAGYAVELAALLTGAVLKELSGRVRRAIERAHGQRAVQDAYEQGFRACFSTVSPPDRCLAERYAGVFRRFVQREAVVEVFAQLVDVQPDAELDLPRLEDEFAAAGYDVQNYPGIDFAVAMRAFAVGYVDAVDRSEELHHIVQVRYLRQIVVRLTDQGSALRVIETHTAVLPDIAGSMKELVSWAHWAQRFAAGRVDRLDQAQLIAQVQVRRHEGELDQIILLMQALRPVLRAAEEASADVAGLREEVRLLRKEIDRRTERGLSRDELDRLEALYRGQIVEAHQWLTFQGMLQHNQPVALPLTDVFVRPWVVTAGPTTAAPEEERLRRRLEAERALAPEQRMPEREREDLIRRLEQLERERWERAGERSGLAKAMAEADNQAMVLLGDPGAGKTTLLRYLALTFAEERAAERLELNERRLPILIPLAAYERGAGDLPLSAFLARYYETDQQLRGLAPLFRQALDGGGAIVLLDGLDEVVEANTRRLIALRVQEFTDHYVPLGNRLVLTSRWVGYQEAPLPGRVPHFEVLGFSDRDISAFLHSWSVAFEATVRGESLARVSGETLRAAEKRERGLREAVESPNVKRLGNNPLLLTILAVVYTQEGLRLPRRRVELYDRYSRILIETWNRVRSQAGKPVGKEFQFLATAKILSTLALWLQQKRPSGMARGEDVRGRLRDIFLARCGYAMPGGEAQGGDPRRPFPPPAAIAEAARDAEAWLQAVREHCGLVVERGWDTYGFMHRTFQEYFAAWALAKMSAKERWEVICAHVHDPGWREVILLTAGQIGVVDANEREVTAFVRQILGAKSHLNELLHRDELLAAACLGDEIEVSAGLAQAIVKQVGQLLCTPLRKVADAAGEVLGSLKETDLAEMAIEEAAGGISREKGWARGVSALTLADLDSGSPRATKALVTAIADPDRAVRSAAVEGVVRWEQASDELVGAVIERLEQERNALLRMQLSLALMRWKAGHVAAHGMAEEALLDAYFGVPLLYGPHLPWKHVLGAWLEDGEGQEALGKILRRVMGSDSTYARRVVPEMLAALARAGGILSPVWAQALRDPDRLVREAALQELLAVEQVPDELAGAVAEMRQREEVPYLRQMANGLALKLGQLVVDETGLVEFLTSEQWQVRQAAAQALGRSRGVETDTLVALVQALGDGDSDVRQAARETLASLAKRDARVVTRLRESLTEDDEKVRVGALWALASLEQVGAEDEVQLVDLLEHQDWEVRQAAAQALAQFEGLGGETVVALVQTVADGDSDVRRTAREALASLAKRDARVVSQLLQNSDEDDEKIRVGALQVLASLDQVGLVDEVRLVELLGRWYWDVRQAAVQGLSRLDRVRPETLVALVQTLGDSHSNVREAAEQALTGLAERGEVLAPALLAGLASGRARTRVGTAELAGALGDRCPKEVRELLWGMLREKRRDLKRVAANALLALGLVNDEVTNVFKTDLHSHGASVHRRAYENLLRIAGPECGLMVKKRRRKLSRAVEAGE